MTSNQPAAHLSRRHLLQAGAVAGPLLLAEKGIRVNAVAPGPIWTPLIPSTMPQEQFRNFGADTPLKRPGQPAELAPTYVLLASSEASYVTGEVFGNVGGRSPY